MKKSTRFICSCLFVSTSMVLEAQVITEDPMLTDAIELATTLGIPNTSTSLVWTTPFFIVDEIVTNGLHIVKHDHGFTKPLGFIVSSNGNMIAYGQLIEKETYEAAYMALMLQDVDNSMPREMIAKSKELKNNGIGDFYLIGKKWNATFDELNVDDYRYMVFVRGAKAVRLYGKDNLNVQPIAEVLDGLLRR